MLETGTPMRDCRQGRFFAWERFAPYWETVGGNDIIHYLGHVIFYD
jgi:hypothetical protein